MLSASVKHLTFSQHEQLHAGSLGVADNQCAMSKSCNKRLPIIDVSKATKSLSLLRINKEACVVVPLGKKAKHRATMEVEWQ